MVWLGEPVTTPPRTDAPARTRPAKLLALTSLKRDG
jgi:hypothetical protein